MIKASDIRRLFGAATQSYPVYLHSDQAKPVAVKGPDANPVKFPSNICKTCNNARTQRHDRAWEKLSAWFANHPSEVKRGGRVPLSKAFGSNVTEEAIALHLFFVKLLGCQCQAHAVGIPLKWLGRCIFNGVAHPNLFLRLYAFQSLHAGEAALGELNFWGNKAAPAAVGWSYRVGRVAVGMLYAEQSETTRGRQLGWHPSNSPSRIAFER